MCLKELLWYVIRKGLKKKYENLGFTNSTKNERTRNLWWLEWSDEYGIDKFKLTK